MDITEKAETRDEKLENTVFEPLVHLGACGPSNSGTIELDNLV
ncbi:hypothetical protein [Desulfotomaculum sp. 1211_IL3151]